VNKSLDAIIAGHLCLDFFPDLTKYKPGVFIKRLLPGKLLNVGSAYFSTGGPVSNTGQALHVLGMKVRLLGKIGEDEFGQIIRKVINQQDPSLTESLIVSNVEGTSYTIILNPPGIDRVFLHFTGTNDTFNADDINSQFISQAKLFHFGYPPLMRKMYVDSGKYLSELMRKAKESKVITSLDMALPDPNSDAGRANWLAIIKRTLPYVDLFLPSVEEITYMINRSLYEKLISKTANRNILPFIEPQHLSKLSKTLLNFGAKIVVFKLGERGLYVRTQNADSLAELSSCISFDLLNWSSREIWAPCFRVNVVGTTGAGDATVAGFLASFIKGLNIEEAIQMATAVGACCVEELDAISGIKSWELTQKRITSGWKRHTMHIQDSKWIFDKQFYQWEKRE